MKILVIQFHHKFKFMQQHYQGNFNINNLNYLIYHILYQHDLINYHLKIHLNYLYLINQLNKNILILDHNLHINIFLIIHLQIHKNLNFMLFLIYHL